jgi:hypothetical protein
MSQHYPTIFAPSHEQVGHLLTDLADPDLSLRNLADAHGTTLDALTLFLAREDIAERIAAIEHLAARRARLIAATSLSAVAAALARIVEETDAEIAHVPVNPKSLPALEQRRRTRETARRAGALLLRVAQASRLCSRRPERNSSPQAPLPRPHHSEDEPAPLTSLPAYLPTSPSSPSRPKTPPGAPDSPPSRPELNHPDQPHHAKNRDSPRHEGDPSPRSRYAQARQ